MTLHFPPARRAAITIFLLSALAACSPPGGETPTGLVGASNPEDVLFLTLDVAPDVVMEALFEGRVVLDDSGCLRLDAPGQHTVVWPKDFSIAAIADGELEVRDPEGRPVGRVGGTFGLGGGEVPSLHAGIGMTQADRDEAERRCPGRYWITGKVR